ncbi:MAG: hypothetical protein COV74_10615 [Candidatus Omnitrophica bacterium CG11_big_fil_rev_8_21_14_0_20_45_26]|uniref:Uncharacterized protein n=1 Tax=Candidatus Abzuiibacterium crystallinum TaxID=1974748 RepID=A0A2H0LKU5_9BACT|nr:MAG: hypothetical protein COV74_10615 [Candidatus Omnitrophica bacterium CG11_big_fil_rev_8_21_14_0_20_45_26]PIW63881.1 MAG: hypothetical protein COW12_08195 [Candidatus Omnitrophica bacterium CG12_big_fil_rev_8_21_14_0_65_45_16]
MTEEKKSKWFYDVWFVILMLLTIGPFAFPLLWKSTKFSRVMKWTLTILFVLLTVGAIWSSIEMVKYIWQRAQEIQAAVVF